MAICPKTKLKQGNSFYRSHSYIDVFGAVTINSKKIPLNAKKSVEGVGKKRKLECKFCLGIINKQSMKKHLPKCELYIICGIEFEINIKRESM